MVRIRAHNSPMKTVRHSTRPSISLCVAQTTLKSKAPPGGADGNLRCANLPLLVFFMIELPSAELRAVGRFQVVSKEQRRLWTNGSIPLLSVLDQSKLTFRFLKKIICSSIGSFGLSPSRRKRLDIWRRLLFLGLWSRRDHLQMLCENCWLQNWWDFGSFEKRMAWLIVWQIR